MKRSFLTALICVSALILTILGVLLGVGLYKNQTEPAFRDVTVELGTDTLGIDDFLLSPQKRAGSAFVSNVSLVDLGKVGTTPITLKYGSLVQTVNLTVQDTTAPKVEFVSNYTVPLNRIPKPEDFIVSLSDCSDVTVSFTQEPQVPEDYAEQNVTILVTDLYGNTTEGTAKLRFDWFRSQVDLELGNQLTKADILFDPEKDDELVNQKDLDEISKSGVGTYELAVGSNSCTVTVRDTLPPELMLKQVSLYPEWTCTIDDFILATYDASGNIDLELLTQLPFGTEGDHVVKIKATDKNGLSVTEETLLRIHKDITPPAIYGMFSIELMANTAAPDYMKNVYAVDSVDGYTEVTCDASEVDLTRAGVYRVIYTSTDSTGNLATRTRKVTVKPDYADTEKLIADIAASLEKTDPESLRDYVRNNITYAPTWGGEDKVAFGFTNWYGNCMVHAKCLQALLDYFGYENELIWVIGKTHYWNLVKIDGQWYHIDSTPGTVHTRYSLMDNQKRLATLGGRRWDTSLWPQMNEETKEDKK